MPAIDSFVGKTTVRQSDKNGPSVVIVTLNHLADQRKLVDHMFVGDTVEWLGAEWRVWDIEDEEITLVRLDK